MSDEISSVSQQELKSLYKNNLPNLNFFEPKVFSKHHIPNNGNNYITGILYGPSKSGKTTMIEDLYKKWFKNQYDRFVIMSTTINEKDAYNFIDQTKIVKYSGYSRNYLKALLDYNIESSKPIKTLIIFELSIL